MKLLPAHDEDPETLRWLERQLLYRNMVKGLEAAIAEADKLPDHDTPGPMTSAETISAMANAVTTVLKQHDLEKKEFLLEVLQP